MDVNLIFTNFKENMHNNTGSRIHGYNNRNKQESFPLFHITNVFKELIRQERLKRSFLRKIFHGNLN